jgi:hypothetical protein
LVSAFRAGSGKHTIVFDFKYEGPGLAKGGTGVLTVDGKEVARKTVAHTIPIIMTAAGAIALVLEAMSAEVALAVEEHGRMVAG